MLFSTNINFLNTEIPKKSLRFKLPHFSTVKLSSDSDGTRNMIEGVFPRIFPNAFFDLAKAKKKSNTPICVESGETARRARRYLRGECFRTIDQLIGIIR